jgi:hypothetical protein
MAQVNYTVDFMDGVWMVGLNGKSFGPYSSLDAAVTAASNAAHKAEAQGYDAMLTINTPAVGAEARDAA